VDPPVCSKLGPLLDVERLVDRPTIFLHGIRVEYARPEQRSSLLWHDGQIERWKIGPSARLDITKIQEEC